MLLWFGQLGLGLPVSGGAGTDPAGEVHQEMIFTPLGPIEVVETTTVQGGVGFFIEVAQSK